jgi:hypothetical protein
LLPLALIAAVAGGQAGECSGFFLELSEFVKAMGNPVIMGVLAVAAAKMIGSQKR